jgi:hypothetical protein
MAVALLAGMGITSQARADVNPYGATARFISVGKKNECATIGYTAEGHMVDGSGKVIPNSTWKTWDGNLRGCNSVAVFAWDPSNPLAELTLTTYHGNDVAFTQTFRGDMNFCLLDDSGTWKQNVSTDGGGGSGACTAAA